MDGQQKDSHSEIPVDGASDKDPALDSSQQLHEAAQVSSAEQSAILNRSLGETSDAARKILGGKDSDLRNDQAPPVSGKDDDLRNDQAPQAPRKDDAGSNKGSRISGKDDTADESVQAKPGKDD